MKKMAVYVSSYDGCSDLWDVFFDLFDRFWNSCEFPVYLINNEKSYTHGSVNVLHVGPEKNWFDRTIKSIEQIKEPYILFMLEDYFLSKNVSDSKFETIIDFLEKNDGYYYQLSMRSDLHSRKKIVKSDKKIKYPVSLQPAVWRKKDFLQILKDINGTSPWDFEEYYNTHDLYNSCNEMPGVYYDMTDILGYKNGVLRGKWIPDTVKFYKKNGIIIDTGKREILSRKTLLKYKIAVLCSKVLPSGLKNVIKKILKLIRFDYLR